MAKTKTAFVPVVKITAHKDYIAIELFATKSVNKKLTLSFDHPGCFGQLVHGLQDQLGVSKEALALLARVGKSRDSIGDIDCFKSGDGDLSFGWIGGGCKLVKIDAGNQLGSSTYIAPTAKDVIVIPNDFPAGAKAIIDKK